MMGFARTLPSLRATHPTDPSASARSFDFGYVGCPIERKGADLRQLGFAVISVFVRKVGPTHDAIAPRHEGGNRSAGQVSTFRANIQSHAVTTADRNGRRQKSREPIVEAKGKLGLSLRDGKTTGQIEVGGAGDGKERLPVDDKIERVPLLLRGACATAPMKHCEFKMVSHFPTLPRLVADRCSASGAGPTANSRTMRPAWCNRSASRRAHAIL